MQRGQLVDDGRVARLELGTPGIGPKQVERRAADELRDERPRLGGRADGLAQRQFVERRALGQVCEGEQPLHRQRALEDHAVQVLDEAPKRVDPSVANDQREELGQKPPQLVAVFGVERFRAAVREDGDRIRRDDVDALQHDCGNLLAQVVLHVPVGVVRIGGVAVHGRNTSMVVRVCSSGQPRHRSEETATAQVFSN